MKQEEFMEEPKQQIAKLFLEIQQGNRHAFDRFFLLYHNKLISFAKQYTKQTENAEEIVSALFVKIWVKRHELSSILNPEVYLFIAVKNACLNLIRSQKKRNFIFSAQGDEVIKESIEQHNTLEEKELSRILRQAIAELPEQRQLIFKLIKENGLKSKDVAKILSISTRTVENQLYKAVKTLAGVLSDYLGYHPQQPFIKKQSPILFFF